MQRICMQGEFMKKINPETWRNYKFAGEEDGKNCTIYYLSDSDGVERNHARL